MAKQTFMQGVEGLLGNPLFNLGVGLLANNQGHYGAFGPALAGGLQQAQYAQQVTEQQKQQKLRNEMLLAQQAEVERKVKAEEMEAAQKQAAMQSLSQTGLLGVSPELAQQLAVGYPKVYEGLLENKLTPTKPPTSVLEFQYGQEVPDYVAYQKSLAASGAAGAPQVRVEIPGAPAWRQLTEGEYESVGGSPQYPVMVSEKGDIKEVPGARKAYETQRQIDSAKETVRALKTYKEDLDQGRNFLPFGKEQATRDSKKVQAVFAAGKAFSEGAIQQHEQELTEQAVHGLSVQKGLIPGAPGAASASLDPTIKFFEERVKQLENALPSSGKNRDSGGQRDDPRRQRLEELRRKKAGGSQ